MSNEHPLPIVSDLPSPVPPRGAPAAGGRGASGWEPGGSASGEALRRYLASVLRWKWVILTASVAGGAAGVAYARTMSLQYEAETTLWIEVPSRGGEERGPLGSSGFLEQNAWVELLKSYAVLDPVVEERRMYVHGSGPADGELLSGLRVSEIPRPGQYRIALDSAGLGYVLRDAEGAVLEHARPGQRIGRAGGFEWVPPAGALRPGQEVEFRLFNPRDQARMLGERIQARMSKEGNFLRLSLVDSDATVAAAMLNAVTEQFVRAAAELKRSKLDQLTSTLGEQLRQAEQTLHDAEMALEAFRVGTITLPGERAPVAAGLQVTRDPVFTQFFDLRREHDQVRRDREVLDRLLAAAGSGDYSVAALGAVSALEGAVELRTAVQERNDKRAELRALQQRYTDEYEPVRRVRSEVEALEQGTIPQLLRTARDVVRQQELDLESRIAVESDELRQIPPRTTEELELERQVEIAGQLHSTLKQRYEEARLAAASTIPDVRVLDRASVPYEPLGDQRPLLIIAAFIGAFGLAVMGAIVSDRLDPRVRYPQQVVGELGLPILGAIPEVRLGRGRAATESQAVLQESLREVRLGLIYALEAEPGCALAISSSEVGDGKTFVAANLARAYSRSGQRTLLIDGDLRRGRLHTLLQAKQTPGLSDYLRGDVAAAQIVQRPQGMSFALIAGGTPDPHSPERLASGGVEALLEELRPQFDIILVDTPPLGAGADAYVLGTQIRNMLLVLRSGSTNRSYAGARLELLDRLPVRVVGAVLNSVPAARPYGYVPYAVALGSEQGSALRHLT